MQNIHIDKFDNVCWIDMFNAECIVWLSIMNVVFLVNAISNVLFLLNLMIGFYYIIVLSLECFFKIKVLLIPALLV